MGRAEQNINLTDKKSTFYYTVSKVTFDKLGLIKLLSPNIETFIKRL